MDSGLTKKSDKVNIVKLDLTKIECEAAVNVIGSNFQFSGPTAKNFVEIAGR